GRRPAAVGPTPCTSPSAVADRPRLDHRLAASERPSLVGPQAEPERPEIADSAHDDGRPGSRGTAGDPWMVGHADLDDRTAALPELDEELGREERAAGFDTDPLERRSPEELARAVDVADAQVEEEP